MPNIEFSFYHSILESHNLLFLSPYLSFFYANTVSRALQAPKYFPGMRSSPIPHVQNHNRKRSQRLPPKRVGGRIQRFKVSNPVDCPYDVLNTARVMQGKGKNTEQDKP